MQMKNRRARVRSRRPALVTTALMMSGLVSLGTIGAASVANAAEFDYPGAIDGGSIVVSTTDGGSNVTVRERLRIDAGWELPDEASEGQTFGFVLPSEFARFTSSFSVPADDDPTQTVAECAVSADAAPVVVCTLTDYVEGRSDVSGSLWMTVSADEESSESTVDFIIDGQITPVAIPGSGIGPEVGTSVPSEPEKWSWQAEDGSITWQLALPGSAFADADAIMIDDALTPAGGELSEHRNVDDRLSVWTTNSSDADAQYGIEWTGQWNEAGTAFQLEIPGPIDPTRFYNVRYSTVPVVPFDGASYANVATINGLTLEDTEDWEEVGGGNGNGRSSGDFEIVKSVAGEGSGDVPDDLEYSVVYSYGDPVVEQTLEITAGEPQKGLRLPVGTVVTLEELTPPAVEGIEWEEAAFSGQGVEVLGDGRAQLTIGSGASAVVTLTNTAAEVPEVPEPESPGLTPPPPTEPTPPTESTPPPTPVDPPAELPFTDGSNTLASTGGDAPLALLWGGAAALCLGLTLSIAAASRRRRVLATED